MTGISSEILRYYTPFGFVNDIIQNFQVVPFQQVHLIGIKLHSCC